MGRYAEKVVQSVLRRYKSAEQIICINDPYNVSYTIKDSEHILHLKGTSIKKVYMKSEDIFPPS